MFILFDNDGTLYDTAGVSVPAVQEGFERLRKQHPELGDTPSEHAIKRAFGLPLPGYAESLLPESMIHLAWDLVDLAHEGERRRLLAGQGNLFLGIPGLLKDLKSAGWKMGLVSNCDRKYLTLIWDTFGYQDFFDVGICHGDHPEDHKGELMARALEALGREGPPEAAGYVVGDRHHDMDGGRHNNLHTVFCTYGFGHPEEGKGATFAAGTPTDLHSWLAGRHGELQGPGSGGPGS